MIKEIQGDQLLQLADLLLTPEQPHDFIENVDDEDEDACALWYDHVFFQQDVTSLTQAFPLAAAQQ